MQSSYPLFCHAAAAAAVLLLVACGRDLSELEPIPHPELDTVEEGAREQLEEGKRRLAKNQKDRDDLVAAGAFGAMGELYHAYGLLDAAKVAYSNAATLSPGDFAWPYYSGLLAEEAGDLEAAESAFRKALELRSESDAARARLGEVLLAQGQTAEAKPHFEALVDKKDFAAVAAHGLARVAAAEGDHGAAVEHFEKVLELQPRAGGVRNTLAQSLRALGRVDEAQTQLARKESGVVTFPDPLRKRLDGLPRSAGSFLRRGNQALLAGRIDEAADLFDRGIAANPENLELRLNAALAMVRGGRLDDALLELREALDIDPKNAQVHHDLGTTYRAKGLEEEAIAAFEKAIELEPDYASAHFNLANTYGSAGRWVKAEKSARRVLELEPEHPRARYLAAMAQHQRGQSAQAEAELRRLLEADPAERIYREGLASILSATGRVDAAVALILASAELEQPKEEAVSLLNAGAKMVWAQRRPKDAVAMWRKAIELDPRSSDAHTHLANGLQLLRQREEALELFRRAVELDPENATAWLSEGALLILEGRHGEAKTRLGEALELHPNHLGLVNAQARLLATSFDNTVRDGELAIVLARQAYSTQATLEHAETMAMALAEAGRFEKAIQFQRGLVQKAQATGNRGVLKRLVTHLRLFENRRPVRSEAP